MKHKGLSWDGGKKRLIAAMALAAVMVLPGVAQARTTPVTTTVEATVNTATTTIGKSIRGVSWG
mgnify:CR=1 FL=1